VFTSEECFYCIKHKWPAQSFAARLAAKEACSKALGTGMRLGIAWRQIVVAHETSGKPLLYLSGEALNRATNMGANAWHISLSHERDYAAAVVILSARNL
jgi:holo-[acyl-carrier protein] synthase